MSPNSEQRDPARPVFVLRHAEFGDRLKWLILQLGRHGYQPVTSTDSLGEALRMLVERKTQACRSSR